MSLNYEIYMENDHKKMSYINTDNNTGDEIDLYELSSILWQGKWLIIVITFLFAVASVIFAMSKPNLYKSEVLLFPAEEQNSSGIGALAGQFGGLASLAGMDIGGGQGSKAKLALEVLKSRQFISQFIEEHKILPQLMAGESWNIDSNTVNFNSEAYNEVSNEWVRDVSPPLKPKPSLQEAYKEFVKILSVSTDKDTGMVTLSVEFISPTLAQEWALWLIEDLNNIMKTMDVSEATKSTEFLMKQLKTTQIADIRTVLYTLIEEQAKTIMFANVRDEYVFKTIDPPLIPEEKSGPKRALICLIGVFLGGFLSVLIVTIRHFIKKVR